MMKVEILARVSTEDQDTDNQILQLQAMAERRGWELVEATVITASAWKSNKKPWLEKLYVEAFHGKFDILLVWALDRLTRGGAVPILEIVHKFRNMGIEVISYQEPWTEAPGIAGDLLLSITGWMAQIESERRSERTRAGMERARVKGMEFGRPGVLGFVNLEYVRRLRADGKSWHEVWQAHPSTVKTPKGGMKRPSERTIRRAVQ